MDLFREKQNSGCGIGGVHCHCCNPWRGYNRSAKRKLNQIARSRLKREDEKYFIKYIDKGE